jgi:ABC-type Zn2+ transport system substrate-binding protein/surface adhesin
VADAATARDLLKQNVYGNPSNGITKLYAQLLAAKLNVAAGASPEAVSAELQAADAFLAGHDHTAWAALGAAQRDGTLVWKDAFDAFNNGLIGPGHCGDGDDGGERPRGEHPGRGNAAAVW